MNISVQYYTLSAPVSGAVRKVSNLLNPNGFGLACKYQFPNIQALCKKLKHELKQDHFWVIQFVPNIHELNHTHPPPFRGGVSDPVQFGVPQL